MEDKDFSNLSDDNRANLNQGNPSWNTASAIRGDDGYNPNSLADMENSSTSGEKIAENDVLDSENSPWTTNFSQGGTHKSRSSNSSFNTKGTKKFLKAKIATAILGGVSVIGIGIGSIFTAGLAPIHVAEIVTEKINSAASIMETRSPILMTNKFNTKGAKCSRIKAACKFEKVSDKQKAKLEKAGFEVEVDNNGKITKLVEIETKAEITSNNLRTKLKTDPKFRTSLNKAYSGRFASFLDSDAMKFMKKFGFSKTKGDNSGKSETDLDNEMTENANSKGKKVDPKFEEGEDPAEGDSDETKAEKAEKKAQAQKNKDLINDIKADSSEMAKMDVDARADALKAKFDKVSAIQLPCTLYSVGNMINIGVKSYRALQLAQFAMSFLSFAHKFKSGQPTAEEYAMIGNKMMAFASSNNNSSNKDSSQQSKIQKTIDIFAQSASTISTKGFTDSQGWRALAYNDRLGSLDKSASKFSLGATGEFFKWFQKIRNTINNLTDGNANTVCKIVTSDAADVVELGVNILMSLTPAGLVAAFAGYAAEQAIGAVIGKALEGLPSLLAGEIVNEKTRGEDYGNSVMAGAGSLMSKNALTGGANTLSKKQAVAFYQQNEILIAENAAYERSVRSPFDPTTRHTFVGSIVSSIIPYQSSIASIAGFFPSVISIASRSISNILPGASAADTAGFEANMEICQDDDMKQIDIATDAFCNPYTGISNSTLTMDTGDVIQELADKGHIKLDTEDPREAIESEAFKKYIKNCPNRTNPIGVGSSPDEFGLECSSEKNSDAGLFSSYLTDTRIQEGMDMDFGPLSSSSNGYISGNAKSSNCKAGDICWPIDGANAKMITPGRWFDSGHNGYDFGYEGIQDGTSVYNIADGEVLAVGKKTAPGVDYKNTGYGPNILKGAGTDACNWRPGNNGGGEQFVMIKHEIKGRTVYSTYSHMRSNTQDVVNSVGKRLAAGIKIGEVGNYGCSTGSHLHFSIMTDMHGGWIDPKDVLGELK